MWKIKKSLLEDLMQSARNYYPDEFMCFLSGNRKKEVIEEFVFLPSTNGKNFASISVNSIPIDDTIIGSVHSHPSGSVRPSNQDKRLFSKYPVNIIIGTGQREVIAVYDNKGEPLKVKFL